MRNELIECGQGEHLATGRNQHLAHVIATDAESTSIDAGNQLVSTFAGSLTVIAHLGEILNASDLVSRCAVITGNLRFNNRSRGQFSWHEKVWGLFKARNTFGP